MNFLLSSNVASLDIENVVEAFFGEDNNVLVRGMKFEVNDSSVNAIELFDSTSGLFLFYFNFNQLNQVISGNH